MTKKKIMISQPMRGRTEQEIREVREYVTKFLEDKGYEVVDSYCKDYESQKLVESGIQNTPVYYLAQSIAYMSKCDAIYFVNGWEEARGCRIEHAVAEAYGFNIIYEI